MKNVKKILEVLLTAVLILNLAACSGRSIDGEDTGTKDNGNTVKQIVISVGYPDNPDTPHDKSCQLWKEKLEELSGGTMTLELYPSDQLGDKNDLIDQMIAGQPVITIADGAFYADRGAYDMGIVFGPYLFDDWDDCWALTESDWWEDQCEKLSELGITIVADNWVSGIRHTMTTFPVNSVEDFKEKKIRVPDNTIQIKGFEAMGAVATPMQLSDVYTALQQGTIDGVENPLITLQSYAFQEVCKYLVLDGHVLNFATWCTGTEFYNTLTDEQKEWLKKAGEEAGLYSQEQAEETDTAALEALKKAGVKVKELTAEEKQEFVKASMSFYEDSEITKNWSDDLYNTVRAAMGK